MRLFLMDEMGLGIFRGVLGLWKRWVKEVEAAITLSGAMGQEESRNLSENIQWCIKRIFEEGLFSHYKHFMRYRSVEGEFVIVPEQAKIVR